MSMTLSKQLRPGKGADYFMETSHQRQSYDERTASLLISLSDLFGVPGSLSDKQEEEVLASLQETAAACAKHGVIWVPFQTSRVNPHGFKYWPQEAEEELSSKWRGSPPVEGPGNLRKKSVSPTANEKTFLIPCRIALTHVDSDTIGIKAITEEE
eukprot:323367_1